MVYFSSTECLVRSIIIRPNAVVLYNIHVFVKECFANKRTVYKGLAIHFALKPNSEEYSASQWLALLQKHCIHGLLFFSRLNIAYCFNQEVFHRIECRFGHVYSSSLLNSPTTVVVRFTYYQTDRLSTDCQCE